ncbi:MAG: Peptidase E [Candidatus Nomurabacteria bacterium GW2011_GWE1_32_28]|uniref:Peptidase E n=1 Tax=Candidatus Nomurabacteria bacterium GW2011_GWF1_31_48 TaxID=1618767 RepID=A0A0G0ASZ9_9BACT|nr:MAG: Peptidase E [Candidatus Nomurabacteria bacterium GW2011_GWF2_30_133]KKP28240.1 MAG: Peptidase E [Candidatus Nomurabacteria bacterium GW2011_GWE2_31_40]KKP29835.1 MAG: Peptidase E [Candidatus Nomurabacteria bacterium GW2011_GWF1_31_48]KKP34576.1 MAG: Peptidase E [Candidatus Nomurabacteria bacterium GW2011_GWE1_32_28]
MLVFLIFDILSYMKKIIAIGGGEIGRPGFPIETTKIDKEIIKITGKKNPKLLFIPTASSDSESYFETVKKHFGKSLGCKTDVLYLIKGKLIKKEIKDKILKSDIVYVGGGDTLKMMKIWKKNGVDKILKEAYKKGIVLSGLSAGSICWFKWGNSDSAKFKNPDADMIKVSGLGLIKALHCPHYDVEKDRKSDLKKMMKKTPGIAIAIENCCAIEVIDDEYRIISSKSSANAYKVYWKAGKYYEEVIKKEKNFKLINKLF